MGIETKIAWTHSTFNPWWGCQRVSPACENCYAEAQAKRYGHDVWGPEKTTPRRFFSDKHWMEPRKWNLDAKVAGERRRVFCASMADVFEDRRDLDAQRDRLWELIETTTALDWLLLTKRPEKMIELAPDRWRDGWPANVWAGTTVENQEWADRRLPALLRVPAQLHFCSYEPALGPIDFFGTPDDPGVGFAKRSVRSFVPGEPDDVDTDLKPIDWIIVGGESGSGPDIRPFDISWARSTVAQARAAGVAVFVKQMGAYPLMEMGVQNPPRQIKYWRSGLAQRLCYLLKDRKGGDPAEWSPELNVREIPASPAAAA